MNDCGLHHIALCLPGQDHRATNHLRSRGYCVLQPMMPVIRPNKRRESVLSYEPIFSGYVFIRPSPRGWEGVRTAPGMRYGDAALLKVNNRLAFLRDDDADFIAMLQTERRLHDIRPEEPGPKFRIGDRVHISKGPWMDFWGNIETLDSKERVCCLLDLLGRKVRAYVKYEHLAPA